MNYKQTPGIVLRKIGDVFLLIPAKKIEGIGVTSFLVLNQTGSLIWECLREASSIEQVAKELAERYSLGADMLPRLESDAQNVVQAMVETHFAQVC